MNVIKAKCVSPSTAEKQVTPTTTTTTTTTSTFSGDVSKSDQIFEFVPKT